MIYARIMKDKDKELENQQFRNPKRICKNYYFYFISANVYKQIVVYYLVV